MIIAIIQYFKPIVSWLEGSVARGGLSIEMASDLAVAQDDAVLAFALVNIGFVLDMGASFMLSKNFGLMKVNELLMIGKRFDKNKL